MQFLIIEEGIPIGFFEIETDRDLAFGGKTNGNC